MDGKPPNFPQTAHVESRLQLPMLYFAQSGIHLPETEQNFYFRFQSDEVLDHLEVAACLQILLGDSFSNESTTTENGTKTQHQSSLLIEKQMLKNVFDVKIFNPNPHAEAVPKAI